MGYMYALNVGLFGSNTQCIRISLNNCSMFNCNVDDII